MFDGKRIVITGGSSGLGKALAERLARRGASLELIGRDPGKLDQVRAQLAPDRVGEATLVTHRCDVADNAAVADTFAAIARDTRPVDLLINSAGILREAPFREQSATVFREVMDTNFFGTLHCIQAVLPRFEERGQGWIVNVSSMGGLLAVHGYASYCASKHAVIGLSDTLRQELKPLGIRVQVVCPGEFESPMVTELNTYRSRENRTVVGTLPTMPLGRVADDVIAGMERGAHRIIPGTMVRALEHVNRWLPGLTRTITDWRLSRLHRERP